MVSLLLGCPASQVSGVSVEEGTFMGRDVYVLFQQASYEHPEFRSRLYLDAKTLLPFASEGQQAGASWSSRYQIKGMERAALSSDFFTPEAIGYKA
jgi:hypothetical protein